MPQPARQLSREEARQFVQRKWRSLSPEEQSATAISVFAMTANNEIEFRHSVDSYQDIMAWLSQIGVKSFLP